MRTLLLVVVLVLLAVLAGASFVVQAGAKEPGRIAVDRACTPREVPSGFDTLLRCRVTARHVGGAGIGSATLVFQPSANVAIPDRYYFFRHRIDGGEWQRSGNSTTYGLGEIPPGGQREIELDVIVRSTRAFGADEVVVDDSGSQLARTASEFQVTAPPPRLHATIERISASNTYHLRIVNDLDAELTDVRVLWDLALPCCDPPQPAEDAQQLKGSIPPGSANDVVMTFEGGEDCASIWPAALVQANEGAAPVAFAALADEAHDFACAESAAAADVEVRALASGGFGPAPPRRPLLPLVIAASGALIALAGAALRTRPRALLERARGGTVR